MKSKKILTGLLFCSLFSLAACSNGQSSGLKKGEKVSEITLGLNDKRKVINDKMTAEELFLNVADLLSTTYVYADGVEETRYERIAFQSSSKKLDKVVGNNVFTRNYTKTIDGKVTDKMLSTTYEVAADDDHYYYRYVENDYKITVATGSEEKEEKNKYELYYSEKKAGGVEYAYKDKTKKEAKEAGDFSEIMKAITLTGTGVSVNYLDFTKEDIENKKYELSYEMTSNYLILIMKSADVDYEAWVNYSVEDALYLDYLNFARRYDLGDNKRL